MPKFLREPLLHFAMVGAALFVLFDIVSVPGQRPQITANPVTVPDTAIVIDAPIVARLREGFGAVWNRPPTEQELEGLIDSFVTEEILVREALALGLDADDSVVRQRLRLKMEFLLEAQASGEAPDDAALSAYLQDNADRFANAPRVGFTQVYLGEAPSPDSVDTTLAELRAGANPAEAGQRTMLPETFPAAPPQAVDGTFGRGFFAGLEAAPMDAWSGPLQSGYGEHLVLVTTRVAGTLPPLSEIREEVERAWRAERAEAAKAARMDQLRDIYSVEILAGPGSSDGLGQ